MAGSVPETIRLETCSSTMDEARERARAGAPDGTIVISGHMTGGRGRQGRPWHAPPGGLYASIVLRDLDDPHLLTLALGCAVAETLEVAGVEPRLKWVNDVLVGGRKIAGILAEGEATGDRIDFMVVGIGININGHAASWPSPLDQSSTTLEDELGCDQCIEDVETLLLERVEAWVEKVRDGRDDEIIEAWRDRDALVGQEVRVEQDSGSWAGTAAGIDAQGRLLVITRDGATESIATGSVRPAAPEATAPGPAG